MYRDKIDRYGRECTFKNLIMIAPEDFTFPVISTDTNAAVILPPLWRISDSDQGSTTARQRRTFASQIIKGDGRGSEAEAEAESQEKMDLLWEDFNEQLHSSVDSSDSETYTDDNNHNNNCSRYELEEYGNVRQLKLIRAKPKKLGSLVKVMKKLFSVGSNQPTN